MADVLFVCVHNAGRSQMAKAIFNSLARKRGFPHHADSAGTEPGGEVHPSVSQVMQEIGLDVSRELPKLITNEMVEQARRIITMGCQVDADKCPAIFIKGVEDWGLPDPRDRPMGEVKIIRDTIQQKVEELVASLAAQFPSTPH